MTYIVAEPCVNCRYTDCALVCPVEAFHLDDDMLVIHPETCIDCDACVPECPVEAIFVEDKLPAEWASFNQINADIELSDGRGGRGQPKRQSRLLSCSLGTSLAVEIVRFQILVSAFVDPCAWSHRRFEI